MALALPLSFATNENQTVSLFSEGVGFIYDADRLIADLCFKETATGLEITFNDDGSWAILQHKGNHFEGILYSHLASAKQLVWSIKPSAPHKRPEPKSLLQAIRFHDLTALMHYESSASKETYSEMLIEAATCGHEDLVNYCLDKGASLSVDEAFKDDTGASSFALIKAIQHGHIAIVRQLLAAGAKMHNHTFDLDRDAFYHACFLYQVRPYEGEAIIRLMLDQGVDFSRMSAYYLAAVMVIFPQGPLHKAQEDTNMVQLLLASGARVDDFMTVDAWHKDTPLMYAAHMGLLKPLQLLLDHDANVFESFEGRNALDRLLYPVIEDPLMPRENRRQIQALLESLGLQEHGPVSEDELRVQQDHAQATKEGVESLEELFKNL